jgi:hypothetical protein
METVRALPNCGASVRVAAKNYDIYLIKSDTAVVKFAESIQLVQGEQFDIQMV